MITNLENKTVNHAPPAPDLEALRSRVARLRGDEGRQEATLQQVQSDLADAARAIDLASGIGGDRESLTRAMLAQSAAQKKMVAVLDELTATRAELRSASNELVSTEASHAAASASQLEREIVAELQSFSGELVSFWHRCERIQDLRERSRGQRMLSPGVAEALGSSWGEIHSFGTVQSRLALLGKVFDLPEDAALLVYPALREQERAFKVDQERAHQLALEHGVRKRAQKQTGGQPVAMYYDDEKGLVSKRIDYE
jgi:hypothetical protein